MTQSSIFWLVWAGNLEKKKQFVGTLLSEFSLPNNCSYLSSVIYQATTQNTPMETDDWPVEMQSRSSAGRKRLRRRGRPFYWFRSITELCFILYFAISCVTYNFILSTCPVLWNVNSEILFFFDLIDTPYLLSKKNLFTRRNPKRIISLPFTIINKFGRLGNLYK